MARQYGYNINMYMIRESSEGVDPGGNYVQMPYDSADYGGKQGLSKLHRPGTGRDAREIFLEPEDVSGSVTVPVDMRYIGHWLTGLLGDPVTTGSGPYTHVFTSDDASLPSYALEMAHASAAAYYLNLGTKVAQMDMDFPRSGPAMANLQLIGLSETENGSSQAGTPTTQTFARASGFHGVIKRGGSNIGNLNSASFSYNNNLEGRATLNQTNGRLEAIDAGPEPSLTGNINVRFADTTLAELAENGTAVDLDFIYEISASLKLTMAINEAYLERTTKPVDGVGGVDVNYSFEAIYNTSESAMLTATLINDLAGTVYTS